MGAHRYQRREQQLRLRKAVLEIVILRWSSAFLCAVDDCFKLDLVLPRLCSAFRHWRAPSAKDKENGVLGMSKVAKFSGPQGRRLRAGAAKISIQHFS